MKRPILNRSSNGGPTQAVAAADDVRKIDLRKGAGRVKPVARVAVAGGAGSGIPGLIEQPRAAISLPSSKSLASSVTAPLQAGTISPDGAGKRR